VVIDLCGYDSVDVVYNLNMKVLTEVSDKKYPGLGEGHFRRYRLPSVSNSIDNNGAVIGEAVLELQLPYGFELPRINETFLINADYNFVYGIGFLFQGKEHSHNFSDSIVKIDIAGKTYTSWHQKGCTPSEPIFVPNPDSQSEDDGVLLTVVLDGFKKESFLLVLDAKTMTEVARAKSPTVVTYGFHGSFR
jgi:carotenoid cleavage dioxygenase-like enzyme